MNENDEKEISGITGKGVTRKSLKVIWNKTCALQAWIRDSEEAEVTRAQRGNYMERV